MVSMTMHALTLCAAAALLLGGCASFSPDGGFDQVQRLTRERTGQAPSLQRSAEPGAALQGRIDALLQAPLSADSAVALALLNHRGLQARFADLGIAEADLVSAGRLRNPSFSFGRLSGAGTVEIDRAVLFDLLSLLTMPLARELEQGRFEQAQLQAASDAIGVAGEARQAFFAAVAAQQLLQYHHQVQEAADASSELARRMVQAGNFSVLSQLREQAFHADATAQLARAVHRATAERERLARALGVADAQALQLPERLPPLPDQARDLRDAEQTAMDQRLDVLMARRHAEATARALGLSKTTRFVNVLHAGYQNASATGETRRNGYEVELVLPLFDVGGARVVRAEAVYLQALHRTAQLANDARSEVRESHSAYSTAYTLARHYRDAVVPLRKRISDEMLLRYNGMLGSVFELLADAREQVGAVSASVEAQRDFWIADAQLQTALTGRSPGAAIALRPAAGAPAAGNAGH